MDDSNVSDLLVRQRLLEQRHINGLILGPGDGVEAVAGEATDLRHALAIGTVDEDEQLAVGRQEGADHCLDGEGAAALQWNADMAALATRQLDEPFAYPPVDADEVRIARAPVMQHRLLYRRRRGERAGGQKPRIASRGRHNGAVLFVNLRGHAIEGDEAFASGPIVASDNGRNALVFNP